MPLQSDPVSAAGSQFALAPRPLLPLLVRKRGELAVKGMVISIIDDNASIRVAIKRLIKSVGLPAEDFASAEEFLVSCRSQDSACLILDLQLPGMSGLELQSQLHVSNPGVPIVFISARFDERARTRALRAGASRFLQKPFSEETLFEAIKSSLSIRGSSASAYFDREDKLRGRNADAIK
jgi:FixJ family two-component response regulator